MAVLNDAKRASESSSSDALEQSKRCCDEVLSQWATKLGEALQQPMMTPDAVQKLMESFSASTSGCILQLHEAHIRSARDQLKAQSTTFTFKLATVRTASSVALQHQAKEYESEMNRRIEERLKEMRGRDDEVLAEAHRQLEAAEAEVSSLRAHGASVSETLARTKQLLTSSEARAEHAEAQATETMERVNSLKGEAARTAELLDQALALLTSVESVGAAEDGSDTGRSLEASASVLSKEVERVTEEWAGARAELSEALDQLHVVVAEKRSLGGQIRELAAQAADGQAAAAERDTAVVRAAEAEARVAAREMALEGSRRAEAELRSQLEAAASSEAALRAELEAARKVNEGGKGALAEALDRVSWLEAEMARCEASLERAFTQLNVKLVESESLEKRVAALADQCRQSQAALDEVFRDLHLERKGRQTLEEAVRTLGEECQRAQAEAARLSASHAALADELAISTAEVARLGQRLAEADAEAARRTAHWEAEVARLTAAHRAADAALAELQARFERAAGADSARLLEAQEIAKKERAQLVSTALSSLSHLRAHLTKAIGGLRERAVGGEHATLDGGGGDSEQMVWSDESRCWHLISEGEIDQLVLRIPVPPVRTQPHSPRLLRGPALAHTPQGRPSSGLSGRSAGGEHSSGRARLPPRLRPMSARSPASEGSVGSPVRLEASRAGPHGGRARALRWAAAGPTPDLWDFIAAEPS